MSHGIELLVQKFLNSPGHTAPIRIEMMLGWSEAAYLPALQHELSGRGHTVAPKVMADLEGSSRGQSIRWRPNQCRGAFGLLLDSHLDESNLRKNV